jgi:hypothetical protein
MKSSRFLREAYESDNLPISNKSNKKKKRKQIPIDPTPTSPTRNISVSTCNEWLRIDIVHRRIDRSISPHEVDFVIFRENVFFNSHEQTSVQNIFSKYHMITHSGQQGNRSLPSLYGKNCFLFHGQIYQDSESREVLQIYSFSYGYDSVQFLIFTQYDNFSQYSLSHRCLTYEIQDAISFGYLSANYT